ncbi:MAG: SPOR domain-containing protein [Candidatus Binatia bacterium]
MDVTAFGLSRDPFQRSPELDDACLPNTLAALLSELQSSLRSPQGLSVLVGPAGSGKSVAASAFGRRLAAAAHVALLEQPTSNVNAIARDAVAMLDASDHAFVIDDDWGAALRAGVERRAENGRATVLLIDDAHRLSPQTLEELGTLFGDDDSLPLHVFLFGRPRLLDRMQAGTDSALHAHLLQICRLEPLGVRESVRYLERRVALCGGELGSLCSAEAIDEIVQRAEGRLLALEDVAAEALRRAAGRGQSRASIEDVVATPRRAVVQEEDEMAIHQQPLRFTLTDEDLDGQAEDAWEDDAAEDGAVEWGDEEEADDEWQAEDAEEDGSALRWDAAPTRGARSFEEEEYEDDDEHFLEEAASGSDAESAAARRRMFGPAVLTIGACAVLVWAANHLPGPADDAPRGRDARILAERISSQPQQILRLATTAEEADADAQVVAWRAQPAPRVVAEETRPAAAADEMARSPAVQRHVGGKAAVGTVAADTAAMGPPAADQVAPGDSRRDAGGGGGAGHTAAKSKAAPVPVAAASPKAPSVKKTSVPAARASTPVYTVQVGAFKARRNAEDLVARLRGKSAKILQEGGFYRVVSGSFPTKKDATSHEAKLRQAGYSTYVRSAVF